jgi:hypothetical protein
MNFPTECDSTKAINHLPLRGATELGNNGGQYAGSTTPGSFNYNPIQVYSKRIEAVCVRENAEGATQQVAGVFGISCNMILVCTQWSLQATRQSSRMPSI